MIESLQWHIDNFLHSPKVWLLPTSILCSFGLSVILLLIFMPILDKLNIVDKPNSRRAHLRPTIRGGGIALVIAFVMTISAISTSMDTNFSLAPLLFSVLCLGFVSFLDDVIDLSIITRLSAHFIVSAICVLYYISPQMLFRGELHPLIDMILCVIGIVFAVNIYNFLDGVDGITAAQSIHLSITIIVLCIIRDKVIINIDVVFYSSAVLLGCALAFLIFNWNPARVFLGDVGSTFFGMIYGLNMLIVATSSNKLFLAAFISCLYYIADGGITILIRMLKGEKIWLPHLNHFFQQARRKGMNAQEIVIKIALCNSILFFLSVLSIYLPHLAIMLSIFTISCILIHFHE